MNKSISPIFPAPVALRTTLGSQFSLGRLSSLVSSMLTTLASGGIKKAIAFRRVQLIYNLYQNKVFGFEQFQEVITQYYKQPKEILRKYGVE